MELKWREESMPKNIMPKMLFHYYEKSIGPFVNLSDLPLEEAEKVLNDIRCKGDTFAAQRKPDYLSKRFNLGDKARELYLPS